ncbi:MAG: TIGR02270 family protein, partial [Candidatus Electrothrix sp. AR4]|nr:TIGR02270 family protein [Candidatus Electrothrix sp. AR4]
MIKGRRKSDHKNVMSVMVIEDIITQHAEDAAFLWLLRDSAVHEPHYDRKDLAELDNRVEAHLDGLRIAGDTGWEICKDALIYQEPGEIFAAAVLAFTSKNQERIDTVLEAGSNEPELVRGTISALGWLPWQEAEQYASTLAASDSPQLRAIGLAAYAIHRQDPGRFLTEGISSTEPLIKARALKAAGELGRADLLRVVQLHLQDEDPKCRFYEAWSLALLGRNESLPVLQEIATSESRYAENACATALRIMPLDAAHAWLRDLSQKKQGAEQGARLSVLGAGVLGDPVAVPWLIQTMEVPELARVAGEALSMITGLDLAYEDLEGEWPEGFTAGPTDDPEDEDVDLDPDEDLPWPEPALIAG